MEIGKLYKVALSRWGDAEFILKKDYDNKTLYKSHLFYEEHLLFLGTRSELYECRPKPEKFVFLYMNEIWFSDPIPYNFEEVTESPC